MVTSKIKMSGWDITLVVLNILLILLLIGSTVAIGETLVTETGTLHNIAFMTRSIAFIFSLPAIFQFRFNRKNNRTQRANWFIVIGLLLVLIGPASYISITFYPLAIVMYLIGTVLCCLPQYTKTVKAKVEHNHINSGYQKPSFGVKKDVNGFTYKKK